MASFKNTFFCTLGFFFLLSLSGCLPDAGCEIKPSLNVNQTQLQKDIDAIEAYLTENNIEAEVHKSGIRYVINTQGDGKKPSLCNQVTVSYQGRLLSDGSIFDNSEGAVAFSLNRLILGWQLGIPLLKEGGNITLYIPSVYGYGSRGSGDDIPAHANLIFEINLVRVF